jgi:Ca-activated chloride channel homolog
MLVSFHRARREAAGSVDSGRITVVTEPKIELIPARPAVCSDQSVVLDVLVRITPPQPEVHFPRAPLNLALVIDHSGSMAEGKKIVFAREAAAFAVKQLLPTDRVSVTLFDEVVETVVPGGPVSDKPGLVRRIERIQPRGSTNLHGGWAEGGRQAEAGLASGGVNRVLLLSDGMANAGVVDPNTIAAEARGLAVRGVGTTTMGVGDVYNEDLMEAMALAGDGRYYYIESPVQLVDIFQTELQGLMDTLGQKVSLGLDPKASAVVTEVLNDLERALNGRLMLPNLVVDMPVSVVVRLKLPPSTAGTSLLEVRLAWDAPRDGGRRVLRAALDGLPAVPMAAWSALPEDADVREQVALLMVARAQKEAARAAERGDNAGTKEWLINARGWAGAVPTSADTQAEIAALTALEDALDSGHNQAFIKGSKSRSYNLQQNQSSRSRKPPGTKPPAES